MVVALALLIGVYLTIVAGWPIVAIGSRCLAAIAYTGGPYPLGYHGLGDLFVMIFFGFVAVWALSLFTWARCLRCDTQRPIHSAR